MTAKVVLNTVGSSFDIVGMLLLFKFGLPSKAELPRLFLEHDDAEQKAKINRLQASRKAKP